MCDVGTVRMKSRSPSAPAVKEPRSAAEPPRSADIRAPKPAIPDVRNLAQRITRLAATANGRAAAGNPTRRPSPKTADPVVQRQVHPDWMPIPHLEQMIDSSDGDRARGLEAYLSIPVGTNMEMLPDLFAEADRLVPKILAAGGAAVGGFVAAFGALRANPPADLAAQLQALALRVNPVLAAGRPLVEQEQAAAVARQQQAQAREARVTAALRRVTPALAIRVEKLRSPKQAALLLQWQGQLQHARGEFLRAPGDDTKLTQLETFLGRIEGLELNDIELVEYDSSWKHAELASDIVVDSGGAVVGATINIKRDTGAAPEKFRRRLTVSKARHMWDYATAITNEPDNSLLPRGTDLRTVEADILEMARDLKARYVAGREGAAYEITTATGRTYRINKTTNEYPHSYPVSGGDVVPLTQAQYNFLVQLKPHIAGLTARTSEAKRRVLELRDAERLSAAEVEAVQAIMGRLNLESAAAGFAAALADEAMDSGVSSVDRASARGKKSKPRKAPGPRIGWNGEPIKSPSAPL